MTAMIDIANDPGLRNPLLRHDTGDTAVAAGFLAKPAVDFHAAALPGAHDRPVALRVVGDQTGPDDANAIVRRVAARRRRGVRIMPPRWRPGKARRRPGSCVDLARARRVASAA